MKATGKDAAEREKEGQNTVIITRHPVRANIGLAQTPQAFAFPEILMAHKKAQELELRENIEFTDDSEIWGRFCGNVIAIPGCTDNRKITFPSDLRRCEK
jgi:2-C-methyl-D-erythritol 4-phosphate cytidylyltransferase/2-C-methyl-D-erythritol 4-phosphate cytidylyltransferase/2-C-methyl-D-erythritol 2,4-cyclodiphosphate synthase